MSTASAKGELRVTLLKSVHGQLANIAASGCAGCIRPSRCATRARTAA